MISWFILVAGKARIIVVGAIRIAVPGVLSMRTFVDHGCGTRIVGPGIRHDQS